MKQLKSSFISRAKSVTSAKKPKSSPYEAMESADEGNYMMVLVVHKKTIEEFNDEDSEQEGEYYGINVLIYNKGRVDAATADKLSKDQWKKDKEEIIRVAKEFLAS